MTHGNGRDLSHEEKTDEIHAFVRSRIENDGEIFMQMGRLVSELAANTEANGNLHRILKQILPRLALRERQQSRPDLVDENGWEGEDTKTRLRRERDEKHARITALEKAEAERIVLKRAAEERLARVGKWIAIVAGSLTILGAVIGLLLKLLAH
jgi:hypothetical protein